MDAVAGFRFFGLMRNSLNAHFKGVLFRNVQSSLKDFEYVEDHSPQQPRARRQIDFSAKLRPLPARETSVRVETRIPMQSYLCERFAVSSGNRRHDPAFKLLRDDNIRRQAFAIAKGNFPRSRTSGDWHPITAAEIAAIKAAEEAAQLAASREFIRCTSTRAVRRAHHGLTNKGNLTGRPNSDRKRGAPNELSQNSHTAAKVKVIGK